MIEAANGGSIINIRPRERDLVRDFSRPGRTEELI
jgi:hypothetical protein